MGRGGAGARQFPECRSLDINPGAIRAQLSCKGEPAAYHADVPLCLISTRESFLSGMALYEARPDKGYSLVDCISMQRVFARYFAENPMPCSRRVSFEKRGH